MAFSICCLSNREGNKPLVFAGSTRDPRIESEIYTGMIVGKESAGMRWFQLIYDVQELPGGICWRK